jgi:hypothetical protein
MSLSHCCLDGCRIEIVSFYGEGPAAKFPDGFNDLLCLSRSAGIGDSDIGTILGQRQRNGRTDTPAAAGNERNFVIQARHDISFSVTIGTYILSALPQGVK